jgi:hypothetical protein
MQPIDYFLLAMGGVAIFTPAVVVALRAVTRKRREALRRRPFSPEWEDILRRNVAIYRHLPEDLREQLHGHIQVFLAEKRFEGCGGLEVTDEIRLTIAAQACILMLNRPDPSYYRKLVSILVYPHSYVASGRVQLGGLIVEGEQHRLGESYHGGSLVLAWDHVRAGTMDFHDGHNVVLHEFAHQLDQEHGPADGAPALEQHSRYVTWARVLGHDYDELREQVRRHHRTVMDAYGATNPAEFFAVATETFFEKPRPLRRKHPELYNALKDYFHLDPAEWVSPRG